MQLSNIGDWKQLKKSGEMPQHLDCEGISIYIPMLGETYFHKSLSRDRAQIHKTFLAATCDDSQRVNIHVVIQHSTFDL